MGCHLGFDPHHHWIITETYRNWPPIASRVTCQHYGAGFLAQEKRYGQLSVSCILFPESENGDMDGCVRFWILSGKYVVYVYAHLNRGANRPAKLISCRTKRSNYWIDFEHTHEPECNPCLQLIPAMPCYAFFGEERNQWKTR